MKKTSAFLLRLQRLLNSPLLFIIIFIVLGGIVFLVATHASTPYVSKEVESGTLSSPAKVFSDPTASGGQSVQFGQGPVLNSGLRIAVNDIGNRHYISGLVNSFKAAGVNWDRLDVGNGTDFSLVDNAISLGIKPLVLYNVNMTGMAPATVAAEIKSTAQKLQSRGLNELEFGNEIYCNGCNGWKINPPSAYAAQYAASHAAIANMGIKLIANATGDYQTSNGTWSQDASGNGWIHDFIKAMPGGPNIIDAWSTHPYGPMNALTSGEDGGWLAVPRYRNLAVQYGSNAPWYITEVGQRLSDVSQAQQATDFTQYLDDTLNKYTWVVYFAWYEVTDDSTGQWGLVNVDNATQTVTSVRPSFNALKTWMSTHPGIHG